MEVYRTIEIRGEERVVRQQRKNHIRGILLISQLLRKGTTEAAGKPVQSVVADEVELLEKGREHVEGIRERASKRGKRQPAAAAAASSAAAKKAKRKGADAALSDPLALAHDGGTRSGATPETSREEAVAEERRSSAMDLMQNDPVLMERVRAMLDAGAAEQAAAKVAAIDAANTRALRASLQALKQHCNSSIGWTTYQTALAVAAGAGEHTCTDTDVCHPGQRCKPVESGGVSLAERANSLGIRHETFSDARWRMHNTNHDIAPKIAASEGCYVYNERKTRSDVTNPEVMALARAFWHSDDVSRATGNSGARDMYKESKKRDAPSHPRRQLMHKGDSVWRMFLESRRYLALKSRLLEQDSNFTDPGRTTFLSTRCGCLVDPTASQCACQIHTQQTLYLEALSFLMGSIHQDCDCECNWCDDLGCKRWSVMCQDLSKFSDALACEKVNLLEGDSDGGFEFWGRKPACAAMKCSECGFGKPGGIPTNCTAIAKNRERVVAWIRFEDQTMPDGKVHKKQQLPQTGKLEDLWDEFMAHSVKYMEHHALSQVAAPSPQDVHGYTSSGRAVDRDGLHREVQA